MSQRKAKVAVMAVKRRLVKTASLVAKKVTAALKVEMAAAVMVQRENSKFLTISLAAPTTTSSQDKYVKPP